MIDYSKGLRGRTALQLVIIFYARKLQQAVASIWFTIFHPLCGGPDQLTVSSVLVLIRTSWYEATDSSIPHEEENQIYDSDK